MTQIILIRGAPAVGKTTITLELLKILKTKHGLDCAYICEDDFRKQMQFKYKAKDLIAHKNSVKLIETVILKLLSLDKYDFVFIEGQFRYKDIIQRYFKFAKQNNFPIMLFELKLDLVEMKKRDMTLRNTKSKDIAEVKKDIDSYTHPNSILINTTNSIESTIKIILDRLF